MRTDGWGGGAWQDGPAELVEDERWHQHPWGLEHGGGGDRASGAGSQALQGRLRLRLQLGGQGDGVAGEA